jgi:hypothetical protein
MSASKKDQRTQRSRNTISEIAQPTAFLGHDGWGHFAKAPKREAPRKTKPGLALRTFSWERTAT